MVAGSESSKFRACGSNIYDPNNTALHNLYYFKGGNYIQDGAAQIEFVNHNAFNLLSTKDDPAFGIVRFDASRCSSLYGASTTVQPKTMRALCLIRADEA